MNLRSLDDEELFNGCVREMKSLEGVMTVGLRLSPSQAMALVAALQLAFRHPGFQGTTRESAERIVAWVQSEFLQYDAPHLIEMIRRGELKEYDQVNDEKGHERDG